MALLFARRAEPEALAHAPPLAYPASHGRAYRAYRSDTCRRFFFFQTSSLATRLGTLREAYGVENGPREFA